jgi:hypothetical protein
MAVNFVSVCTQLNKSRLAITQSGTHSNSLSPTDICNDNLMDSRNTNSGCFSIRNKAYFILVAVPVPVCFTTNGLSTDQSTFIKHGTKAKALETFNPCGIYFTK